MKVDQEWHLTSSVALDAGHDTVRYIQTPIPFYHPKNTADLSLKLLMTRIARLGHEDRTYLETIVKRLENV